MAMHDMNRAECIVGPKITHSRYPMRIGRTLHSFSAEAGIGKMRERPLRIICFTILRTEDIFTTMKRNTRTAATQNLAACREAAAARHYYCTGAGG